jgi:excisionase family DNA binding protein
LLIFDEYQVVIEQTTTPQWLTLGQAAKRFNVHVGTMRRWANDGRVAVMVTPGGHRRFSAADLDRLAQPPVSRKMPLELSEIWHSQALAETRREVDLHRKDNWLAGLGDEVRQQNRLLGQRLMGLILRYLSGNGGDAILDEARQIGRESGQLAFRAGLKVSQALEASIFFRDRLIDSAFQLPEHARIPPAENRRLLQRVNELLNAVLLAIAEVYHDDSTAGVPRS